MFFIISRLLVLFSLLPVGVLFNFDVEEDYAKVKRSLKQRCQLLPIETLNTYTNLFHMTISEVEKDGKGMSQEEKDKRSKRLKEVRASWNTEQD